jgi:hypothetical protein
MESEYTFFDGNSLLLAGIHGYRELESVPIVSVVAVVEVKVQLRVAVGEAEDDHASGTEMLAVLWRFVEVSDIENIVLELFLSANVNDGRPGRT